MLTKQMNSHITLKQGLPLHRELDDGVELAEQSSGSLSDLDVVTVCEAGGGGRGAQLCLSASLGLLQWQ